MTVFDGSTTLPLWSECKSRETSAVGGGAITEGAGRLNLALREDSRSGAETGGGMTAALVICTGEREPSRLTADGAGGITLPFSEGAERTASRETFVGAGAIIRDASAGATSVRSLETLGAGGITAEFNPGAARVFSLEMPGAGGMTESRERAARE